MSKKEEKALGFEAALKRLETLVEEMESGEIDLDAMIAAFEEGQRLVTRCNEKLNEVEQRIEKLVKRNEDGEVSPEPFNLSAG